MKGRLLLVLAAKVEHVLHIFLQLGSTRFHATAERFSHLRNLFRVERWDSNCVIICSLWTGCDHFHLIMTLLWRQRRRTRRSRRTGRGRWTRRGLWSCSGGLSLGRCYLVCVKNRHREGFRIPRKRPCGTRRRPCCMRCGPRQRGRCRLVLIRSTTATAKPVEEWRWCRLWCRCRCRLRMRCCSRSRSKKHLCMRCRARR
mmetsp:Transcript_22157/g.39833  ORF Transcript_22157/g.39833 Transcript_22157/m.39833 type:complete len:200 (+) Transcript_22157:398-997(+)